MSGLTCNLTIPKADCTLQTCCIAKQGFLNYLPNVAWNGAYAAVFAAILLAQVVLVCMHRKTWAFFIAITCGLLLEVIGYIGRIMLHNGNGIFKLNNFVIYLVCLTIAPAFFMASIYMMMSRVLVAYGAANSLVKPRVYSAICITGDLISLVLQAAGGAIAAGGSKGNGDKAKTDRGTHIMMAGLSFQLFSTFIFAILCAFYFRNVLTHKYPRNPMFREITANWRFKGMLGAVFVASLTIFIRSAFRVDELKDGFKSDVANNETLFMIFEGPMLIIAGLALTFFHPGIGFQGTYGQSREINAFSEDGNIAHSQEKPRNTRGDKSQGWFDRVVAVAS